MNKCKAQIEYRGIDFSDFYTFSEFVKKCSEAKKTYTPDSISIVATDGAQVISEDVFMQVVLPLGIPLACLGSPLTPGRFVSWQRFSLSNRQAADDDSVIDSHRKSMDNVAVKDKDKKKK